MVTIGDQQLMTDLSAQRPTTLDIQKTALDLQKRNGPQDQSEQSAEEVEGNRKEKGEK